MIDILQLLAGGAARQDPTRGTGHVFNPYGGGQAPNPANNRVPMQQKKTPWLQQTGLGGLSKSDLLLSGMGMLSGRNFQEGMGNAAQYMAYGMDRASERQKEQAQKQALMKAMVARGAKPEDAGFYGLLGPQGAATAMNADRNFEYQKGRDEVGDTRWQDQFDRQGDWREQDVDWRTSQAEREQGNWENQFGENRRQFGMTYGLSRDKFGWDMSPDNPANILSRMKIDEMGSEGDGYRAATPEEVAQYGYNPETTTAQIGPKGQFKVVNEGAGDKKPLIGSEAMVRVAANLPNMKDAVANLDALMGNRGTEAPKSEGGRYAPGHDWGAQWVNAVPDFGLLKPVAKALGGKDYQQFTNAYDTFAGAVLPILSGSAVTPQERENIMSAIEVLNGDDGTTAQRKLQNMKSMVAGIEAAAAGDMDLFNQYMDELNAYGASIRAQNNGQPAPQPSADPEGEALVNKWLGGQ